MNDEHLHEMAMWMFHEHPKGLVDVTKEYAIENTIDMMKLHKAIVLSHSPHYIRRTI